MVNKGSFFQRLKERWGSGSGVRVETRSGERGAGPVQRVEPERTKPNGRELASELAPAEARSQRRLSEREEALLALGTHFKELSTMLRGSQARMDDQLEKLVDATSSLSSLPALSQQQLEMLREQNVLGEQLATTMKKLPNLLQSVEGALQRAAATDERTAATVREFQSTMDRIHSSMGQMVKNSEVQTKAAQQLAERSDESLKGLVEGIEQSHQKTSQELMRTTDESLQSLRRSNEDQSNRLQRTIEDNADWNRAVLFSIGFVVLGIGALIVLQIAR
jgi:methyl-accepting chemotaxis protein